LRPQAIADQQFLERLGLGRTGTTERIEPPTRSSMRARISRALPESPRARSSITRSSVLVAKVTPQAFTH
jgi:hypothetical protein